MKIFSIYCFVNAICNRQGKKLQGGHDKNSISQCYVLGNGCCKHYKKKHSESTAEKEPHFVTHYIYITIPFLYSGNRIDSLHHDWIICQVVERLKKDLADYEDEDTLGAEKYTIAESSDEKYK